MSQPAPVTPSGSLIAYRADRLGARLISIVNAIRIAEDHGAAFSICWPRAGGMSAALNDATELFAPGFVARHMADQHVLGARRRAAVSLARCPDEALGLLAAGRDVAVEMVRGVAVLPGEDADRVAERAREVFRALPWAEAVAGPMARLGTELRGATACHIRRGDLIRHVKAMHKPWPNKYVPDEFFVPHIEEALAAGRPVVVFSDDAGVVARLARAHPGLRAAADLVPAEGLTEAQRDLLELAAMSLCERIVAPEGSAFSATAATLAGRPPRDVVASLPEPLRAAACEALLARLRARPDSFEGPGEIGQCVPHLVGWLEAAGRGAEAARLCDELVRGRPGAAPRQGQGLAISFVTAEAMRLALAHAGPEAAAGLALLAPPPARDRDLVACRVTEAAALAALGEGARARRALLAAFGTDPDDGALQKLLPLLAATGALAGPEFLPHDPELFALAGRRLPPPRPGRPSGALAALIPPGARLPDRGATDPLRIDWAPFLPVAPLRAATERWGGWPAALARAATAPGASPALRSADALVRAHAGEPAAALRRLAALAAEAPQEAMVLHRLSHARWLARDPEGAAEAALRALAVADLPLHHAWAGLVLSRRGRTRAAAAGHLRRALAADTALPALPLLLAEVERRLGRTDAALGALETAARLAPNDATVPLTRARLLLAEGDLAGARSALETLIARDQAAVAVWRLLAEVETAAGRPAAARAALARGLALKPADAALNTLAEGLG